MKGVDALEHEDDSLLKRVEALDEALASDLEDDRFGSGVPDGLRSDDEEFLRMSGLGIDNDAEDDGPAEPEDGERSAGGGAADALSFHEVGVEDVDGQTHADESTVAEPVADELSADLYAASPSMGLKELIAGLSEPSDGVAEPIPDAPPDDDTLTAEPDVSKEPAYQEDTWATAETDEAPSPAEAAPDEDMIEDLLSRVKGDILAGLKADLSAISTAQEEVVAGQRATAAALDEQRAAVAALQRAQEAAAALEQPRAEPAAVELAEAEDVPAVAPAPRTISPELLEAERLIQEMQDQPRDEGGTTDGEETIDLSTIPTGEKADLSAFDAEEEPSAPSREFGEETDGTIYNQPRRAHVRRSSRRRRRRRRIALSLAVAVALAALGAIAYQLYPYVSHQFVGPDTLLREATRLMDSEQFVQASNTFRQMAGTFPDDSRAEYASFMSAYALSCIPEGLGERHYAGAIELLKQFESNYPNSEKLPRAHVLRGILNGRMGNYTEAITLLSVESSAFQNDPSAALPSLRTLARCYAARGEFEDARSKLLKAVSMPNNFALDKDYEELAALSATQAAKTMDAERRKELVADAERYYLQAMTLPSVDPERRSHIETQLASLGQMERDGFSQDRARSGSAGGFTATTEIAPDPSAVPSPVEPVAGTEEVAMPVEPANGEEGEAVDTETEPAAPGETSADVEAVEESLRETVQPDVEEEPAAPDSGGETLSEASPVEPGVTMEELPDLDGPAPADDADADSPTQEGAER